MTTGIGVLVLESRSDGTGTPGLMTSSRQRTEYGVTESYSRYIYMCSRLVSFRYCLMKVPSFVRSVVKEEVSWV